MIVRHFGIARLGMALLTASLTASPAMAARPVAIDDRIEISTQGSGPDIVLIPGLASSAAVWDKTAARLAAHYRVHVVQILGFAGTRPGANETGPVIRPATQALHHYLAARHLAPVAVVGHSLGGLVGMELALDHPADLRRLLIVDTLPFFGSIFGAPDVATIAPRAQAASDGIEHQSQADYAAYTSGKGNMTPMMVKTKGPAADAVTAAAAASSHIVVAHAMAEDMTTDLRGQIAGIAVPVTVLYPWDKDSGLSAAQVDTFYHSQYANLPKARLERIDDSRHFIMIDRPEAFDAALDHFLNA